MRRIIQNIKRLLRSVTVLDIVVVVIVFAVAAFFLLLRFAKHDEWVTARIMVASDQWTWEGSPPTYWFVDNLTSGMSATNSFGETVATINDVSVFDNGAYYRRAFIDVSLKVTYDQKRNVYTFNFQPLQVGKPVELTFGKYNVQGLVTYLGDDLTQYQDKEIEVKMYEVRQWMADEYKVGMEMKDTSGRVLATITSVKTEPHTTYEFSDIRGQNIVVSDPDYRDVTFTVSLKAYQSENNYYFVDRAALKVGETVWFQFPTVAIQSGVISKILK